MFVFAGRRDATQRACLAHAAASVADTFTLGRKRASRIWPTTWRPASSVSILTCPARVPPCNSRKKEPATRRPRGTKGLRTELREKCNRDYVHDLEARVSADFSLLPLAVTLPSRDFPLGGFGFACERFEESH